MINKQQAEIIQKLDNHMTPLVPASDARELAEALWSMRADRDLGWIATASEKIAVHDAALASRQGEAGEWDVLTKKEMWDTIQHIRVLTGNDGTEPPEATVERLIEKAPAPSEAAPEGGEWNGQAWMIELNQGRGPAWFTGDWTSPLRWTKDPNRAVKFATRADADAVILGRLNKEGEYPFAFSHSWPAIEDKYIASILARVPRPEASGEVEALEENEKRLIIENMQLKNVLQLFIPVGSESEEGCNCKYCQARALLARQPEQGGER